MDDPVLAQDHIRSELNQARADFHALLESLSEDDFRRQSRNPGWTNCEILAHITFGFIILNALLPLVRLFSRLPRPVSRAFARLLDGLTGPFNWINALGARGQGKVFTRARIGAIYDRAHSRLQRQVARTTTGQWRQGMDYPSRWDPNFKAYMTMTDLFLYPIEHQRLHMQQIQK